ncbi:MAG: hypothetical protein MJE12_03310 [Alphaproteobacteria bacterium]|nr:hypothetical protein [Alphaproteobacteria bacterium]
MKIQGRQLILKSGSVELENPAEDILEIQDRYVVLFLDERYERTDPRRERNIVGLDFNGEMLWRIQRTPSARKDLDGNRMPNPYVALEMESGELLAYDVGGICWTVDPETGAVSDPIFTR